MTEHEMKLLIEHGQSINLVAVPDPETGFQAMVDTGQLNRAVLTTVRGHARSFKSLDTLYTFCNDIGLSKFEVQWR